MRDIVTSVSRVIGIMESIVTASQEQSTGIEQVNRAVGEIDQMTQQNAALVEQAAAAAASLEEQARHLQTAVVSFRIGSADDDRERRMVAGSSGKASGGSGRHAAHA